MGESDAELPLDKPDSGKNNLPVKHGPQEFPIGTPPVVEGLLESLGARVVKELPPPPPEIMEPTVCENHVSLRQKIDPKDLESVGRFEEDKNCCPDCERKRVEEWGNPTDDDIKHKAVEFRLIEESDPELFKAFRAEAIRFAAAREKEDREGLDMMTWSQFKGCERDGNPFWTTEDYKRLLSELGIIPIPQENE